MTNGILDNIFQSGLILTVVSLLIKSILDRKHSKALHAQIIASADKTRVESEGVKIDIEAKLEEMRQNKINEIIEENKELKKQNARKDKAIEMSLKMFRKQGIDIEEILKLLHNGNGNGHH